MPGGISWLFGRKTALCQEIPRGMASGEPTMGAMGGLKVSSGGAAEGREEKDPAGGQKSQEGSSAN